MFPAEQINIKEFTCPHCKMNIAFQTYNHEIFIKDGNYTCTNIDKK